MSIQIVGSKHVGIFDNEDLTNLFNFYYISAWHVYVLNDNTFLCFNNMGGTLLKFTQNQTAIWHSTLNGIASSDYNIEIDESSNKIFWTYIDFSATDLYFGDFNLTDGLNSF